jgi:hypothetical protein
VYYKNEYNLFTQMGKLGLILTWNKLANTREPLGIVYSPTGTSATNEKKLIRTRNFFIDRPATLKLYKSAVSA